MGSFLGSPYRGNTFRGRGGPTGTPGLRARPSRCSTRVRVARRERLDLNDLLEPDDCIAQRPLKDEATSWALKMSFCAEVRESGCRGAGCLDVPRGPSSPPTSLPGNCRERRSASRASTWTGRAFAACCAQATGAWTGRRGSLAMLHLRRRLVGCSCRTRQSFSAPRAQAVMNAAIQTLTVRAIRKDDLVIIRVSYNY